MTPNTFTELLRLLKVYLEPIDRSLTVEEIQSLFHSTLSNDGQTVVTGRIAIPGGTDYDGTEIVLSSGWGTAPVVTLTDSNVLADSRTALTNLGFAQLTGSVTTATIDTSTNKTLKIKSNPDAVSFTSIVVTSGAATPMATVASDIQTAANTAGLRLVVAVDGVSNKLVIVSETGYVEIDTVAHGSTLSTAAGFATGGVFCEVAAVNDSAGRILIVADTVTGANPTITVTFKDGPFATVPRGYVKLADSDDTDVPIHWYATRSGFVAKYVGTPTATSKTYKLEWFFHT